MLDRLLPAWLIVCGVVHLFSTQGAESNPDPFLQAASLHYRESLVAFRQRAEGPAGTPRDRFGYALALLNAQPRTSGSVEKARDLFSAIAADPASDRDLAIQARYFLGRIFQIHQVEPDFAAAAQVYRALATEFPGHPVAQTAVVRLALVLIYDPFDKTEKGVRFSELETYAPILEHRAARRDYHYVMGVGYLSMDLSKERALHHLVEADRAGIIQARTRASVLVRIGELARILERPELARQNYRRFLNEFPRDARHQLIRDRLASVEGADNHG